MSAALAAAVELLVAAVNGGVRDIVVCPGSRSQALALVAAELERVRAVRLHVRVDERGAAFFALGLARESGRAVPVITTSGTAVANLHPAMLEAHHSGVPLIALTGDRPKELIGTGANQTTVQSGIFGPLINTTTLGAPDDDELSLALAAGAGKELASARTAWHLNVAYREPLSGIVPDLSGRVEALASPVSPELEAAEAAWPGKGGDARILGRGIGTELAAQITATIEQHKSAPAKLRASAHDSVTPLEIAELDPADWPVSIVIAGDGAGPSAERIARQGGWPLVAEVSSGARFGRNLVVAYRQLLGESSTVPGLRDGLELAIVLGHPTLSREVTALLKRPRLRVIVVDRPGAPAFKPTKTAEHVDDVKVLAFGATRLGASDEMFQLRREADRMLAGWLDASRALVLEQGSDAPAPDIEASRSRDFRDRARFGQQELAVSREPVNRHMLVDALWRHTWPHDRLVVAASRLIRDLDSRAPGKRLRVHANRGLAGIDGTIATALGVADASQHGDELSSRAGMTRLLVGDLAFVHDASSLLVMQGGEDAPRLQIVVGNDGGGTIFDGLEVADTADATAFERVMRTGREVNIEAIADAFGWGYRRATTRSQLEEALTDQTSPRIVIEVPLDAEQGQTDVDTE
ncbi:2-succinyl-5-enolpyruvyl-6-hydroxy-3-cyclohexene-1-carboxylic-acid synthase [Gulosibacter sediminis]|uniref:2-succinyl-5-enolpyruvyl-6-hydroxy-3- cyclohexene-1-carboxylic-acid synthase n=1 Tax=Gulosibacter sediminis TaxID=1729695 RepID=UPI0024AD9133|nr:2-succinyl-5-enolpyruvyl-6-hydroxy-3-cyclohexene-1-carboxylic-acid synthase [Gulosibacter sediminis]